MKRSTIEYVLLAVVILIGTPLFAVWGALDGERLALVAYPKQDESKPAPSAELNSSPDLKAIFTPSPENIAQGQALYKVHCIACHGDSANGNGPAAVALTPKPRNFLDAAAKYTRGHEPRDLFTTLTEGNPGTAMAGFGPILKPEERWAIVHYLTSLPGLSGRYQPILEDQFPDLAKLSGF